MTYQGQSSKKPFPHARRRATVQGFDEDGRIIIIARGRRVSAQLF
jgi:hypothetical protein